MTTNSGLDWYRQSENRPSYWTERAKNIFAVSVEQLMKQRDMKKKDLADRMGQSRANISKLLRGDTNLTIETMVKLAQALDAEVLIQLVPKGARTDEVYKTESAGEILPAMKVAE